MAGRPNWKQIELASCGVSQSYNAYEVKIACRKMQGEAGKRNSKGFNLTLLNCNGKEGPQKGAAGTKHLSWCQKEGGGKEPIPVISTHNIYPDCTTPRRWWVQFPAAFNHSHFSIGHETPHSEWVIYKGNKWHLLTLLLLGIEAVIALRAPPATTWVLESTLR